MQSDIGDKEIRVALRALLEKECRNMPDTFIVDELGVGHGYARVDIAVINGALQGYELKSNKDTLYRLPKQVDAYSLVFDQMTLVTGKRHVYKAINIVPDWWGIKIVERGSQKEIIFHTIRQSSYNPTPNSVAILELLWREEALTFLEELEKGEEFRFKKRNEIYNRIADIAGTDRIKSKVRNQLRSRLNWRSGLQLALNDV